MRWLVLVALLAAAPVRAQASEPSVARFALVIGNNHSADPKQITLRYADDDAFATHGLLREAGVESILLVSPDSDTRALFPDVSYRAATLAQFERASAEISTKVSAIRARGGASELFVFYSGHGDEETGGEGYVLLESQQRFTRSMLIALLTRVGATRNHVIIDACKSSLFVFARGRGGQRAVYAGDPLTLAPGEKLGTTGFVLSTASGRESHEWERFHAGILSHELRSALRGAADLNHDGRISYRELRGFLGNANQAIIPRFRPDFLVIPPGGHDSEQSMLHWSTPASLELPQLDWGHVYVETARGERIADLHPAQDRSIFLWAPDERPLFVKRQDETLEYTVIESAAHARVDPTGARVPAIAQRGAPSLAFENLFASPFVSSDLERFGAPLAAFAGANEARDAGSNHTGMWAAGSVAVAGGLSAIVFAVLTEVRHDARDRAEATCRIDCLRAVREAQGAGPTFEMLRNASLALAGAAALVAGTLYWSESNSVGPAREVAFGAGSVQFTEHF